MKFFSVALAAVLAGVVTAKQQLTGKVIEQRLRAGKFDKKKLMANARPYKQQRKLEEEDDAEEDAVFEPTSDYSVHFDSCVALKMKDDNLLDENLYEYAYAGTLYSEKSYVIFSMCYSEDCYYDAEDDSNTYIVDVGTFVAALSNYIPTQINNYCEQCEKNEDYCLGNYDNQDADDADDADDAADDADDAEDDADDAEDERDDEADEGDEGDEGERKLKQVNYIDCNQCEAYECFEQEDDGNNAYDEEVIDYDAAVEWIENLAGCYQTEYQENDNNLYAGLLCNSDGTGVEIGVFMDEDCTLYTTQKSFQNVMADEDYNYYSKASELIEHMFTTDISCGGDNTEYTNPYDNEGADEDDADEDDEDEVGEWCQDLFDNDAQSLYNCDVEEEDDEEDDEDDEWANIDWYEWELDADDAEDSGKVCEVVQAFEGEYSSHNVYDDESSGNLFDYTKNKSSSQTKNLSNGAVAAIIILLIIVAAGGAAWAFGGSKKKTDKKRTPLINGQMA